MTFYAIVELFFFYKNPSATNLKFLLNKLSYVFEMTLKIFFFY